MRAALLALAAMVSPALAYQGDGRFTDRGAGAQDIRYELNLGKMDLGKAGKKEYRFSRMPNEEFTFGLRMKSTDNGKPVGLPRAGVRLTLVNEKDETVFDVAGELGQWVRSEKDTEWFFYHRGRQHHVLVAPRATKIERTGLGPDAGWGSYATLRTAGSYRLVLETTTPDAYAATLDIQLVAVAGGK